MGKTGKLLLAIGVALAGLRAAEVSAQEPVGEPVAEESDWDFSLGGGVVYGPDYLGSDDYEAGVFPVIEISYRDLVFLDGTSLGVNLITLRDASAPRNRLRAGAVVRYEDGREDDENRALEGLGDVDAGVELGGFAEYRLGPWSTGLTIVQDVADGHDGLLAELETSFEMPLARSLGLRLAVGTSWVDDDYMESYFGVTSAQAAASGLRQFEADGGFRDIGLSVGLRYEMFEDWFLAGRIGYARLLGDAADSPIVEDEGSADQVFAGSSVYYRF